jgi:tRNA(Ile)-lysidine synthase
VVGLSGGADSLALLDSLSDCARSRGFRVLAAHLDHGLRPDSSADVDFCVAVCRRLGVPLECGRAEVAARAAHDGEGLEAAARRERYAFLHAAQARAGARWLAVAHTRDDQAETLLLHLLRGSGLTGLGAMRARSGDLLRPLLCVSRADVLAHLAARGLDWREDPTNADRALLRNRVRHELLPYLESRFNPETRAVLARTAGLLADDEEVLGAAVTAAFERVTRAEAGGVSLSAAELSELPPALARGVVRRALDATGGRFEVSALHVERVRALCASPRRSGRRWPLPGGRAALGRFEEVWIGPRADPRAAFSLPVDVPGRVEVPHAGVLVVRVDGGPAPAQATSAVVCAPADRPLHVRTRRPGDRVRAKGRDISLKRFLLQRRVPADQRAGLPLVAAGSQVLWVPGQPCEALPAGPGTRFVHLEWRSQA